MADYVKRIRTTSGDLQIDYNSLANLPDLSDVASADHTHELKDLTGVAQIKQGGTGATDAATARNNLEITPVNIGAATIDHAHTLTDDNITGLLPLEKGGTGAADADAARNNLGITPSNIGAISSDGGRVNGSIIMQRTDSNDAHFELNRTVNDTDYNIGFTIADNGTGFLRYKVNGEEVNSLNLSENNTTLNNPLTVSSGGTGANNSADARNNLEITPANIGAAMSDHTHTLASLGVIYSATEPTYQAGAIWLQPVE